MPTPTSPMQPVEPRPSVLRTTRRATRKSVPRWARRLLLVPAAALVLIGTPTLAIDQPSSSTPTPTAEQVPVAAPTQTVGAGFEKQVPGHVSRPGRRQVEGRPERTVHGRGARGQRPTGRRFRTSAQPTRVPTQARPTRARSRRAARPRPIPVSVESASEVRVTVQSGTVSDVSVSAIDSNPVSAPPGSAGALGSVLPRIDGPARYAYGVAAARGRAAARRDRHSVGRRGALRRALRKASVRRRRFVLLAGCLPPSRHHRPRPDDGPRRPPIIYRGAWGALPFDTTCGTPSVAP